MSVITDRCTFVSNLRLYISTLDGSRVGLFCDCGACSVPALSAASLCVL